jgi:addiction module HigA family antidote
MAMHNPPHPGEFIRSVYLEPFELSARTLAEKLAVSPSTLNRIITGKSGVSPEMALRLSKSLGRTPECRTPTISGRQGAASGSTGCNELSLQHDTSSKRDERRARAGYLKRCTDEMRATPIAVAVLMCPFLCMADTPTGIRIVRISKNDPKVPAIAALPG